MKIEYATLRNRRQTSDMKEQLPKHYFVADEIRQHPNKENKTIVIVIDPTKEIGGRDTPCRRIAGGGQRNTGHEQGPYRQGLA